jgi:hypothetical protein
MLLLLACEPEVKESEPIESVAGCLDEDGDGYCGSEDCNNQDATITPDAIEVCDGLDNNCDGQVDEGIAVSWFQDEDGDGFGDPEVSQSGCEAPVGYVGNNLDCDDTSADVLPGGNEICDEIDNDCNGLIDENVTQTWYMDSDGDGYGIADITVEACTQPPGYTDNDEDCNDADASLTVSSTEVCDGLDNDCDGATDEAGAFGETSWYLDADGDGFGDSSSSTSACWQPSGYVADNQDCNDADASLTISNTEVCDGLDNDCDGATDEAGAFGESTWHLDADGDGFGDGSSSTSACEAPSGYVADNQDCNDADPALAIVETEICDGLDNDCDGATDEAGAYGELTVYLDADSDGFGDASVAFTGCGIPTDYILDATDCNDSNSLIYPGATELCNGLDDDCDGSVDEAGAVGEQLWYPDGDGDGYGDASSSILACDAPTGFSADSTDCDDGNSTVWPGAPELCDGIDNSCDGVVDEGVIGTAACPAEDCTEIQVLDPTAVSGSYTLTRGSYECDMSTDGGGWTRIALDAAVWGTGYNTGQFNTEGFTWDEVFFQYASGRVSAHCVYPDSLTGCNNLGFQFASESWGVPLNWGSSICGMSTTDYSGATTYIGGYDFTVARSTSTDTIRLGTLEGVSSCTTSDNYGTAYLNIWVRH